MTATFLSLLNKNIFSLLREVAKESFSKFPLPLLFIFLFTVHAPVATAVKTKVRWQMPVCGYCYSPYLTQGDAQEIATEIDFDDSMSVMTEEVFGRGDSGSTATQEKRKNVVSQIATNIITGKGAHTDSGKLNKYHGYMTLPANIVEGLAVYHGNRDNPNLAEKGFAGSKRIRHTVRKFSGTTAHEHHLCPNHITNDKARDGEGCITVIGGIHNRTTQFLNPAFTEFPISNLQDPVKTTPLGKLSYALEEEKEAIWFTADDERFEKLKFDRPHLTIIRRAEPAKGKEQKKDKKQLHVISYIKIIAPNDEAMMGLDDEEEEENDDEVKPCYTVEVTEVPFALAERLEDYISPTVVVADAHTPITSYLTIVQNIHNGVPSVSLAPTFIPPTHFSKYKSAVAHQAMTFTGSSQNENGMTAADVDSEKLLYLRTAIEYAQTHLQLRFSEDDVPVRMLSEADAKTLFEDKRSPFVGMRVNTRKLKVRGGQPRVDKVEWAVLPTDAQPTGGMNPLPPQLQNLEKDTRTSKQRIMDWDDTGIKSSGSSDNPAPLALGVSSDASTLKGKFDQVKKYQQEQIRLQREQKEYSKHQDIQLDSLTVDIEAMLSEMKELKNKYSGVMGNSDTMESVPTSLEASGPNSLGKSVHHESGEDTTSIDSTRVQVETEEKP